MLALRAVFLTGVNRLTAHYSYRVVLPYPVSFFFAVCFASVLLIVRLAVNRISLLTWLRQSKGLVGGHRKGQDRESRSVPFGGNVVINRFKPIMKPRPCCSCKTYCQHPFTGSLHCTVTKILIRDNVCGVLWTGSLCSYTCDCLAGWLYKTVRKIVVRPYSWTWPSAWTSDGCFFVAFSSNLSAPLFAADQHPSSSCAFAFICSFCSIIQMLICPSHKPRGRNSWHATHCSWHGSHATSLLILSLFIWLQFF